MEYLQELLNLIEGLDPAIADKIYAAIQAALTNGFEGLKPYLIAMGGTLSTFIGAYVKLYLDRKKAIMEANANISEANANRQAAVDLGRVAIEDATKLVTQMEAKHANEVDALKQIISIMLKDQPMSNDTLLELGGLFKSVPVLVDGFFEEAQTIIDAREPYVEGLPYTETLKEE